MVGGYLSHVHRKNEFFSNFDILFSTYIEHVSASFIEKTELDNKVYTPTLNTETEN